MPQNLLELRGISKKFPGVQALKSVDFSLKRGEVHALIGENGAGKSTLVKIILGIHQPDEGEIILDGKKVVISNPLIAKKLGIVGIPQDILVFPDLTVLENLYIGWEPSRHGFIDTEIMMKQAISKIKALGIELPLYEEVRNLSAAHQELVQIVRALLQNARILIMDEPTAPLTSEETEILFHTIENLKHLGTSVIYISHRLKEIFRVADQVTVLRDGEKVFTGPVKQTDPQSLIEKMIGNKLSHFFPEKNSLTKGKGKVILELKNISFKKLKDITFKLHEGEILGIAGLLGSGRTTLGKIISGFLKPESGEIFLQGKKISFKNPYDAIRNGIVYIPEDRRLQGLILPETVRFNLSLPNRDILPRKFFLDKKYESKVAQELVEKFSIKAPSVEFPVLNLSGGNQQKVVLAKWLFRDPRIIILDEPTQGIDVGTKSNIYQLIVQLAEKGKSVVFISSDFSELIGICDRILILRNGVIVREVIRGDPDFSEDKLVSLVSEVSGVCS